MIPPERGPDRDLALFLWYVIFAIALVTVILLLSACGGSEARTPAERPAPTVAPRRCPALCIGEQLSLANPTKSVAVQCLTPDGMSPGLVGIYLCAVQVGAKCQSWMVAPDGRELLSKGPGPCPIPPKPTPTDLSSQ